ncbi:AraC family transcriptional regulator [Paenibacillus flagellatus]|uniref:AraC family transcriptional regulator n=1 Tax=Paenibacillus flagellatus TaxID=2211139 RepID=A0A2V5K944_9BACL|nr:AraC family transcriptional regulator [Paenibacillus flagellatus]PYI54604.1 AraC family transcriptional regulator [Paenibacillus flagellatus]
MEERYSFAVNPRPGKGELTVLFSGRERTLPAHNVGPQVRDYYLVHHVLSGRGTFQCMGRTYELSAGDSFFIFPGELIRYTADEHSPWTYRWIGFRGDRAEELLSGLGITQHRAVAKPIRHRRAAALFRAIERTFETAEPGSDMRSGGLMRQLLAEYAREDGNESRGSEGKRSPIEEQVERTIRWLTVQYSQPISIENMSRSLGYNRTHLSKMFKQYTGMTPMHFLLKIRMERAKLLLLEQLTVEQVAASVGFTDPLYFSKQFKKWYGRSPTEYRLESDVRTMYDCNA